jgi:hypothetical protein
MSATTTEHGLPAPGAECLVCMDDLQEEVYVEYQTAPLLDPAAPAIGEISAEWKPALICANCLEVGLPVFY